MEERSQCCGDAVWKGPRMEMPVRSFSVLFATRNVGTRSQRPVEHKQRSEQAQSATLVGAGSKKSSSARGRNLLELHDGRPCGAEQRALTLARGLATNVISEPQAHRELGRHLRVPIVSKKTRFSLQL